VTIDSGAKSWPLTLKAAVVLYGLMIVSEVLFTVLAESRETLPLFGMRVAMWLLPALSSMLNVLLVVGLYYRRGWARWLTMLRFVAGAVWGAYDISELYRKTGGHLYRAQRHATHFAYAEWAVALVICILLLLPKTGEAFDTSPFAKLDGGRDA